MDLKTIASEPGQLAENGVMDNTAVRRFRVLGWTGPGSSTRLVNKSADCQIPRKTRLSADGIALLEPVGFKSRLGNCEGFVLSCSAHSFQADCFADPGLSDGEV